MFLEFLLAIVITVVIILLFYVLVLKSNRRSRVQRLLEISNGTFDEPAQQALEELDLPELTPGQHAIRGNILRYNILEGPRHIPRDRMQRRQFGRMVQDYERAVRGLGGAARGLGGAARGLGGRVMTDGIRDDEVPVEIIINNAMTLNDIFGPAVRDPIEEDFDILQMMIMLHGAIVENVPAVRQNLIEQRVSEAVTGAGNRAEAVTAALAPRFNVDLQNVHDTKINGDLNEILHKISTQVDVDAELASAKQYLQTEYDEAKRQKALDVLKVVERGETISTYKDTEDHIFALVWKRCRAPGNDRAVMQLAVAESLADCYDGDPLTIVCINGRCSRVINSLALLDYDPSITGAMTFEAYRNLVMRETKEIFDKALKAAEESEDAAMRGVAAAYDNPSLEMDTDAENRFKDGIKIAIDNMLAGYTDKFNQREINQLREEAYIYATL